MRHKTSGHCYRASILLAVMLIGLVCTTASAKLVNYVILVSMDGLRPDAITNLGATGAPNFYRFRTEGAFTDNARTDYDYTETLPNHTTMLTGRGVVGTTGHNWTENVDPDPGVTLASNKGSYIAGVFDIVHDYGFRTGSYAGKSKFSLFEVSWDATNGASDGVSPDNGKDKIDNFIIMTDSGPMVDKMSADMESQAMDFVFFHFKDPDAVGHAHSWDPTVGSAYSDCVVDMDGHLGTILDLVENNPTLNGRTVIIMTADHGGTGTAHANASILENYRIPFYVWGPVVSAGQNLYTLNSSTRQDPGTSRPTYSASPQPIRNGESTNLALKLLGLPAISGSTIGSSQNLDVNTASGSAPSAPTASSASSVTNCSFTANWSSAAGATGYIIDVATDSSFTNYVSGYRDVVVGNVLYCSVTGLAASTTYYYRVWAYNLDGTSSSPSSTINLTTSSNIYVPSTPTVASASNVVSTSFKANWYVACGATGYRLDVSTNSSFSSYVSGYQNLDVGNVTSKTVSDMNPSTTYYYRVRAYNGIGTSSDSGTANTTTLDVNYCIPSTLLQSGNMEFEEAYNVCPHWSPYSGGPGAPSWANEMTIVYEGLKSQRIKNVNGADGSLIGVFQTLDATVGDAFTFEAKVYPETNPAYAQAAMAARWDGGTSIPDGSASWKVSGGARLAWTHVQNFSGNATSDHVTLFLDSRRISGSVAITAYWDDVVCYRAYVPPAPTVSTAGSTSLYVDVNYGCNSGNSNAEYAITIGGGAYTLGTHYVQTNGTVSTSAAWQTDATWGTKTVTGLTSGVTYTFKTKARYSGTLTQATSLGAAATGTPSGSSPPSITQHPSNQTVAAGETATFTVAASGAPTLTYQWQMDGSNLSDGSGISGSTATTLQITDCQTTDEGNYRCVVTNAYGSATSNTATLTVTACGTPVITNGNFEYNTAALPPYGWTTYIQSSKSGNWTIQTATPPQGTQWQQTQVFNTGAYGGIRQNLTGLTNGAVYTISGSYKTNSLTASASVRYNLVGNTDRASSTVLASTVSTDWGTFSGTVTATGASLTLFLDHANGTFTNKASGFDNIAVTGCGTTPAPLITQHPAAQHVCPGTNALFTVTATGSSTLTYIWQKNGANLANGGHYAGCTTATLSITGTDTDDAANYRCMVSNAGGSATSNQAALTLKPSLAADLDDDCDVDQADVTLFVGCISGPMVALSAGCENGDFDNDNDVDQSDFGIFQRCYSGENMPIDPNCAN